MNRFFQSLLLFALATPAAAEVYCVSTASQLVDAVFAARASVTESEIKIVKGTYSLPSVGQNVATLTITDQTGLTIIGGYNAGCAGGLPNSSPDQTIIRPAEFDTRLMDILLVAGVDSTISIAQLSFRRGRSPTVKPACLHVDGQAGATGRVSLFHTEFTDCSGPASGCALTVDLEAASLNLSNSIIHTNTCNGGAVTLIPGPNGLLYATNNTIVRNINSGAPSAAGLQIGHNSGPISSISLTNNLIYHNGDADDLDLQFNTNVPGFARSNFVGRRNAFPTAMVVSNNSAADPQLQSSTNHRPSMNSPLINAGQTSAPLGLPVKDLDSTARPQNGRHDVGAYEVILEGFKNGFE